MQKIILDHLDEKMNQIQALQVINTSGMSRKNLHCNFIKDGDKCYCLVTVCNAEIEHLPDELKKTLISYKNLKVKAFS